MLNLCVCVCVWFKRASRCAQTHISVLMHVCLCVCLFVYAIISHIRHYLVTTISPLSQVSHGLILNAWGKEGVWCYCGALSRLMTPGTRSPTDG